MGRVEDVQGALLNEEQVGRVLRAFIGTARSRDSPPGLVLLRWYAPRSTLERPSLAIAANQGSRRGGCYSRHDERLLTCCP